MAITWLSTSQIPSNEYRPAPKPLRHVAAAIVRAFEKTAADAQISRCQTVGWSLSAVARGEESPGSTEVRCRVTPGGGDPRESATESTPPACLRFAGRVARVKRCGKSAPRRRQRRRQGKPHREQDQVGAAGIPVCGNAGRTFAPPLGSVARGARQRAPQKNGHPRPQDQLLGAGQNPAYTPSGALFRRFPCVRSSGL